MQTMQQNKKESGFQISKSIINNTCHSKICYNLFWASHKSCRASRHHELLARQGKLVLKLMLVPAKTD